MSQRGRWKPREPGGNNVNVVSASRIHVALPFSERPIMIEYGRTGQMVSAGSIVAELRESILAGEFAPGERLPSAREITRTWNVAIATASRVHALLRAEGLAHSELGVGTTVTSSLPPTAKPVGARADADARPQRSSPADFSALSLRRIIAAGVQIADAEGIEAVTMRRVAHALHTVPKVLYRQVPSRQELERRMVEAALRKWHPGPWQPTWRERLLAGHREVWRVFRTHPWLAQVISVTRPQLVPAALTFAEWTLETLEQAGMAPADAFEAHLVLFTHVRGIAILIEPEIAAESETGVDADTWIDTRKDDLAAQISDSRHPALSGLADSGYELNVDLLFEEGLSLLVEGLASRLDAKARGEDANSLR